MLTNRTVVLRTGVEDLFVHAPKQRGPLSPEQRSLAQRAAFELRVALDGGDARLLQAAEQALALASGDRVRALRPLSMTALGQAFAADLVRRFEAALSDGRLLVERTRVASLSERPVSFPEVPPLPPAPREANTGTFELRLVDEVGQGIGGVEADFNAEELRTVRSNAGGVALLDGVNTASVVARVEDTAGLELALDARWQKRRLGQLPKEGNTQEVVYRGGPLGPFGLKPEVTNTIVLKPPPGKLFVELLDKTGRVRHANCDYSIDGPEAFSGKTDELGRLQHAPVFPGDYELTLQLEHFKGDPDESRETLKSQLVVLEPASGAPQIRRLGAAPRSVLARLQLFFNTNKTFLLPTALPSVRKLRRLYIENAPCELLVVGHADTRGGSSYNEQLSLERAKSIIAYLKDDVETWFAQYDSSLDTKQRWGKTEDRLMIIAMPDFVTKPKGEDAVHWYQRSRGLVVDGKAGKNTRRALIREYLSLDGASLADRVGEIEAVAHGCGENFPLKDDGEELDAAPADGKRDHVDRRVELFFFDTEFGITPKPPGTVSKPGSPDYPKWRERVVEEVELGPDDADGPHVRFIELDDSLFRTNSAVVLPEGEAPTAKPQAQASLTSISGFAMLLRINEERPGKKLFVAGHTDTTAGDELNQKLSQERADCALAVLSGDRAQFQALCNARHKVGDYKQILSWVARAFAGFACAPGKIDDNAASGVEPLRRFQAAYNANRTTLGITQPPIGVDGSVGMQTWGAFFDLYELALADELGETADGVAELRQLLVFVDDERKALGFGEHFPIEELGVDHFRSQTNRRVELLMFDPGDEPDLAHAQQDPETSDLYLPGNYQRGPLPFRPGGAKPHMTLDLQLFRPAGTRSGLIYELRNAEGFSQQLSDARPSAELGEQLRLQFVDVPLTSPLTLRQLAAGGPIDLLTDAPPSSLTGPTPKRVFLTELNSKAEAAPSFLSYDVAGALA